jgi:hypothetical protein
VNTYVVFYIHGSADQHNHSSISPEGFRNIYGINVDLSDDGSSGGIKSIVIIVVFNSRVVASCSGGVRIGDNWRGCRGGSGKGGDGDEMLSLSVLELPLTMMEFRLLAMPAASVLVVVTAGVAVMVEVTVLSAVGTL